MSMEKNKRHSQKHYNRSTENNKHHSQKRCNRSTEKKKHHSHDDYGKSTEKKKHHSHDDYRKLVYGDGSYECQGCKERHSGFRYECKEICKAEFCESCSVEHRKAIPFAFLKKQRMVFEWKGEAPPDSENRCCIACVGQVRGFHYKSKHNKQSSKNHVLHPTCAHAHAPDKINASGVEFRLVDETKTNSDKTNSRCIVCLQHLTYNKSSFYEFKPDKSELRYVHVECAGELIVKFGSPLQKKLPASRNEKYWKLAELLFDFFIAAISGNILAVGSVFVKLLVSLIRT